MLAHVFAVITVVTCGIVITSVQSNAIAEHVIGTSARPLSSPSRSRWLLGRALTIALILIFVFSAMVIFGGIRTVARVTEWMAPDHGNDLRHHGRDHLPGELSQFR